MTYLVVINPNFVAAVERDSIASPDVLRVQVGDVKILYDDVAIPVTDT